MAARSVTERWIFPRTTEGRSRFGGLGAAAFAHLRHLLRHGNQMREKTGLAMHDAMRMRRDGFRLDADQRPALGW